jgi:hypothetical protein
VRACYISGPLRSATPYHTDLNVRVARREAEQLWKLGFAVLCPHLNTYQMVGMLKDEAQFIKGDIRLLEGLDFIVMLPGWELSEGSRDEYKAAFRLDMDCFYRNAGHEPLWTPTTRASNRFVALPNLTWNTTNMTTYANL